MQTISEHEQSGVGGGMSRGAGAGVGVGMLRGRGLVSWFLCFSFLGFLFCFDFVVLLFFLCFVSKFQSFKDSEMPLMFCWKILIPY